MSFTISPASYTIDVRRYFIDTDEVTKSGKTKKRPVTIRIMYLVDPSPITDSGHYKVCIVKRRGATTYSISVLPVQHMPYWDNPSGRPESWSKLGDEYVRQGKAMTEPEFLQWLRVRLGGMPDAQAALEEFLTAQPEPRK